MPNRRPASFCKLIWRLTTEYRSARRIHVYGIHSSKKTQRVLAQLGDKVVLHFLPPYCPEANDIERVWLDLRANVTAITGARRWRT